MRGGKTVVELPGRWRHEDKVRGARQQGVWRDPWKTVTNGHEGGVARGLGLGKGVGVRLAGGGAVGWAGRRRDGSVPLVHRTPDSPLITPAEPLRPSHSSSLSPSSTSKTLSPRCWQPIPLAPILHHSSHPPPYPPEPKLTPPLDTCPSSKRHLLKSAIRTKAPVFVSTFTTSSTRPQLCYWTNTAFFSAQFLLLFSYKCTSKSLQLQFEFLKGKQDFKETMPFYHLHLKKIL